MKIKELENFDSQNKNISNHSKYDLSNFISKELNNNKYINPNNILNEIEYCSSEANNMQTAENSNNYSNITKLINENNPKSTLTKTGIRRELIGKYLMEKMGWKGQGILFLKK